MDVPKGQRQPGSDEKLSESDPEGGNLAIKDLAAAANKANANTHQNEKQEASSSSSSPLNIPSSRERALQNPVEMLRRSARMKSQQLTLERESMDTAEGNMDDLPNVTEEVSTEVDTAASDADVEGRGQENNETCLSSCSSLSNLSARETANLQNPLILQHLFQRFPASIVASCRLVSKQWYEESLVTWRTNVPVSIVMIDKDIFLCQNDGLTKHRVPTRAPLQDFLDFIDKPENQCETNPYRNMELSECKYSLNSEGFNVLWKAVGSNLTTLNLFDCKFSSTNDFRQVIYKCCPILQKLSVLYCRFPRSQNATGIENHNEGEFEEPLYGEHKFLKSLKMIAKEGRKTFPVSWIELFSHFPWLTSFEVSLNGEVGAEFEILMNAIKVVRKADKNMLPFKRFKFSPALVISREASSQIKFALIKELCLPLMNCFIQVHPELDQRFVRNTLDYLAPTVQAIELLQGEVDEEGFPRTSSTEVEIPSWFLDFPFGIQLNNLTYMVSIGNCCGTFTFLKYAPNLSILDVIVYPEKRETATFAMKAVSNTCKEELTNVKMLRLRTLSIELIVSDDDIQHLFNWMPNITDLHMILNPPQLRMVCENWKNLKKLTISWNPLVDKRLASVKNEKLKYKRGYEFLPIVENLKDLELLHIMDSFFVPEYVFIVFLHLPTLQILVGNNCRVERKNLDVASYQLCMQVAANALKKWRADNKNILELEEDEGSDLTENDDDDEGSELTEGDADDEGSELSESGDEGSESGPTEIDDDE